ncbi:MAG: XdhC family protein [Candidatus Adiutrix sp.]|jgi:xanthine dehydrogenase accessory factor|nr:XdhC family protein [Candidatus Adiutrix sp.]
MDLEILKKLNEELAAGHPAVLATVIKTSGSAPRKAGAQMLIYENKSIFGTVGGGRAEANAIEKAGWAFESRRSAVISMDLNASVAAQEGMACGGAMEIFIQYIAAEAGSDQAGD